MKPVAAPARTLVHDFVCTACGCMCDDLTLTVEAGRIAALAPPCPLAEQFLLGRQRTEQAAPHRVDGQPAPLEAALARAADILQRAAAPLVTGLARASTEAQRLAIEIADRSGALIDPTDDGGASQCHAAVQTVGLATATLGEAASRSDLVIYVGGDPAATHPRHVGRFARRPLSAPGCEGTARRIVYLGDAAAAAHFADERIRIDTDAEVACLWTLRGLILGVALQPDDVEARCGVPLAACQGLAERMKSARYVTLFYDSAGAAAGGPDARGQAIAQLVRALHRHTRAAALPLGAAFNAAGAAQALTWQTGFPAAVSLARGYPRYLPGDASAAALLERGEVDAVLAVGADPLPHLSAAAEAVWRRLPTIVVDGEPTATAQAATVALRTSTFGVETTGSVYRSDGVPLPLKAAWPSAQLAAEAVLAQLAARLPLAPAEEVGLQS